MRAPYDRPANAGLSFLTLKAPIKVLLSKDIQA
jgi:hypothetical protein